jgi:DNA-binding winged helix-turn-helix (wHTH) protein/TolB-like protein/Tfp pilus assembly protein PilF
MGLNTKYFYDFGPFRLEPSEQLLLRDSQPVCLTPKAFELLVFLVQNPGRLLTKEQIMQAIWPESFVEEANLTVWISVLRKTLGDGEGGSQYIETVPKRGYRFAAPVQELQSSELPITKLADAAQKGIELIGVSPAAVATAATPKTYPALASDTASPDSPKTVPAINRHKRNLVLAVIACALLAAIAFYLYIRKANVAQTSLGTRSLAILPFQNLKHDSNDDFLGFSLADAVITKLGYVSSLTVRPSIAVQKYRDQVIDAAKIGWELNVDTLLTGAFIHDGEDLRITYQLIDVKSDRILRRGTIDLKYNKLLMVQDDVAQQIIKGLDLNLSSSESERLNVHADVDPLAYEYYLRGVDLYSKHEFVPAIQMLEKSVQLDSNYALTWAYLGASYTSSAAFELGGIEEYRKAQAAYERALALQPKQLEAQMYLANFLIDTGKVEQAVPLLRDALQTNPNHAGVHWELGYAYRFAGMLKESVAECEHARQLDPLVTANNGSVLNTYLYVGEYDKFLKSLPETNDSPFILFYRGFGEYYQKDWQQAAKDFDHAYEIDRSLYTQTGQAFSDSIAHRDAEGLEVLRHLEDRIQQRGVGDPEGTYKIAQAYAVLGDKPSALRMFRHSVMNGFFSYPYFATDPLLDSLRHEPQFGEVMNVAQRRHEAFKSRFF